jgi:hypothetical protein
MVHLAMTNLRCEAGVVEVRRKFPFSGVVAHAMQPVMGTHGYRQSVEKVVSFRGTRNLLFAIV